MYVINAVNVRDALPKAVRYLLQLGIKEETRYGDVWASRGPVCIHYHIPKQHVLVNPVRDANPFFHLMEAIWMLAGRRDAAFLDNYIKDFGKKFGRDGIIWDAYGYRWRYMFGDQLAEIIAQLKQNPATRQCVLQMWNHDLVTNDAKPCNLVATFRIRNSLLDMTVFNRSNDLVWGCCGANAVHFAIMQEYVAAMVGIRMGEYHQISTNLHLYIEHVKLFQKRMKLLNLSENLYVELKTPFYEEAVPLVHYPESFDNEVLEVMEIIDDINKGKPVYEESITNPFLKDVVLPMAHAHKFYKTRMTAQALIEIENVTAEDWRRAGREWIKRRTSVRVTEDAYDQSV
ncbi:MAG: hypothetical protein C5B54_07970 [Acidobacteria bacterium]|nr:MAG: hypothetical protein C5B54_07970 [Acidobacteriota bacterium]